MTKLRCVFTLFLLIFSATIYDNLDELAKKISYQFSPAYKPMNRKEILEIYSGYYWGGCTPADRQNEYRSCLFDEANHESMKSSVDFRELARKQEFEQKYVNGLANFIATILNIIFWGLWLLVAIWIYRYLVSKRKILMRLTLSFFSRLPFGIFIAHINVKIAERKYLRIKRLLDSDLISADEYNKRKGILVESINDNLR